MFAGQLNNQFRQIRFNRCDPGTAKAALSLISSVVSDLILITSSAACAWTRPVMIRLAWAASCAQWT